MSFFLYLVHAVSSVIVAITNEIAYLIVSAPSALYHALLSMSALLPPVAWGGIAVFCLIMILIIVRTERRS